MLDVNQITTVVIDQFGNNKKISNNQSECSIDWEKLKFFEEVLIRV